MEIKIPKEFYLEALNYADLSKQYTSNRHDFHEGGLDAKKRKMFEGKLGEKVLKVFLIKNNIIFEEDSSSYTDSDEFDFIIYTKKNKKVLCDVKTRTENFHIRTLEMVEQLKNKNISIYISIRLFRNKKEYSGKIIGWCTKEDFLKINRVENNGYLDNFVLFDNELRKIENFSKHFKQTS